MLWLDNQHTPTPRVGSSGNAAARVAGSANHPAPDAVPRHGAGVLADGSASASSSSNGPAAGRSGAALRAAQPAPEGGPGRGREAPLGKIGKSVDQKPDDDAQKASKHRAFRVERFKLQRHAATLVPREGVARCKWAIQRGRDEVDVMKTPHGRAFYEGLQSCGSPWLCPVCSAKISETRRGELNTALSVTRHAGFFPVMITLTHRHDAADDLLGQLKAMKKAKQRLRQRREWRAIKGQIVGTITATEVTHGAAAGWHTHFHEIAFIAAESEAEALALFAGLDRVWVACLRGLGLDGIEERAFQVQGAAAAGEYVGKWGGAEELALQNKKKGRRAGRTPWQLLADSREDWAAAGLWKEFAAAFKGTRQLVWSPGLREAVGLNEVSDAAAAEDDGPVRVGSVRAAVWHGEHGAEALGVKHRRGRLLAAAETRGAEGMAEVIADGRDEDGRTAKQAREDAAGEVVEDDADDPGTWDLPTRTASPPPPAVPSHATRRGQEHGGQDDTDRTQEASAGTGQGGGMDGGQPPHRAGTRGGPPGVRGQPAAASPAD